MGIEDLLNSVSKQIVTTSDDALWGGDSFDPAETIVPQEKISLFEYVVKHEKRRPAFFGRCITQPTKSAILTENEANSFMARIQAAARGLKIPTGVYIYCNIEPHWSSTVDFTLGGGGGFYCGLSAEAAVSEVKNRCEGGDVITSPVLWVSKSSGGRLPSEFNGPKPPILPHQVCGWSTATTR